MTVCIAAICDNSMLIGASDRMVTSGDIQFEPQRTKIISLTSSIVVMTAGDVAIQTEALQEVSAVIEQRVRDEPQNWWMVRDVAFLYRDAYNRARLRRAENKVLAPLGLNSETFLLRQQQIEPGLLRQLAVDLKNFYAPSASAIFAGVDYNGPHIYDALNSDITCRDLIGFSAIGAGDWHANSQFMFAGHTRTKPFPETLLLTYAAKKHAEVAPGVGEATDMFLIGPNLGTYLAVGDHVLTNLARIYRDNRKQLQRVAQRAERAVNIYVNELLSAAVVREQGEIPQGEGESPEPELEEDANNN